MTGFTHPTASCPQCNGLMDHRSTRCRKCLRGTLPKCIDCGKQLGRDGQQRCRPCWMVRHTAKTSRPKCIDCGKLISWQVGRKGHPATRCWDCEVKRRRTLATGGKQSRRKGQRTLKYLLGGQPCVVCHYDRLRSHIHRRVPAMGYVQGNMAPLCGNCHNEVHAGIRTLPDVAFNTTVP